MVRYYGSLTSDETQGLIGSGWRATSTPTRRHVNWRQSLTQWRLETATSRKMRSREPTRRRHGDATEISDAMHGGKIWAVGFKMRRKRSAASNPV